MFRTLLPALLGVMLVATPSFAREYTAENPLILKIATFAMPTHPVIKGGINPWAAQLKEQSQGRLVIEVYNPNTLCPDADVYDCVKSGVLDMGAQVTQRIKGTLPLSNVMDLPFMFPTAEVSTMVFNQLFAEFAPLRDEYAGTKLYGGWSGAQFQLHSVKKPILKIEDAKGTKIGAISASVIPVIQALGAAGVSVPMSDCYLAIQRGQVDVMAAPYAFVVSTKIYEATKFSSTINLLGNSVYMILNEQVYAAMPADLKKILDDSLNADRFRQFAQVTDQGADHDRKFIEQAGQKIYDMPAEEVAKGRELTKGVVEAWFADCDKRGKGDAARAMYARAAELSAQYSKELGLTQ